jgi:hypothetical protein
VTWEAMPAPVCPAVRTASGADPARLNNGAPAPNAPSGDCDQNGRRTRVDEHGVWRFAGGGAVATVAPPFSGETGGMVRSTLAVSPDRGRMAARWERSDDGASWQPWMEVTFTRMP